MHPLTKRQHETLELIKGYIAEKGYAPTYSEIAAGLKLASRSTARAHCVELEKKGRIVIKPKLARAIVLLEQK